MKKALVILLALSMVFAAFADDPAAKNEVAEFTGNASVTWGVDLDTGKTGFTNSESANLKFTLMGTGDKATSGEGVWGELKIKVGDPLQYDGGAWKNGKASVDTAKIHIGENFAIGIRSGDVQNGGYKLALAAASDSDTFNVGAFGGSGNTKQGVTFEVALPSVLNLNIDFRSDNTTQYTNNYGVAADVDVKAVDGLTLKVGFGMDFYGAKDKGLFAQLGYAAKLDDKFFIEPQFAFGMNFADKMNLAAGLLFGWGDKNKDPIKFMTGKVSNGFSVATMFNLKNMATIPLYIAVYDTTFVENLAAGVEFDIANLKAISSGMTLAFDAKYSLENAVPTIGVKFVKAATNELNVYAACDLKGLVANTTFTVAYASANLMSSAKPKLGTVNVTAKISF